MSERRKSTRRNTPHRLNVVAAESDTVLGRLVDITPGGLMLVGKKEWPTGHLLRIRIPLPTMINGRTEIEVSAEAVWSRPDDNPVYTRTGFQFNNLSGEGFYGMNRRIAVNNFLFSGKRV